tara:strand:- start:566 stop:1876 length:1311 start_codon:yes stop_codon:yes gene_type:complete
MPNYLNILRQFQDRQRMENPAGYSSVNPYTSDSYIGTSAADLYAQAQSEMSQNLADQDIISPEDYESMSPTMSERGLSGATSAYQITKNIKPIEKGLASLDKALFPNVTVPPTTPVVAATPTIPYATASTTPAIGPMTAAEAGYTAPASIIDKISGFGKDMGAGTTAPIAAIAYSLASDRNPYTYGTSEAIGTGIGDFFTARTAMSLMPKLATVAPWLPIAATALGFLFRKRRAKRKRQEYDAAIEETGTTANLYSEKILEERRKRDANWMNRFGRGSEIGDVQYGAFAQPAEQGMKYSNKYQAAKGMKYSYNMGGTVRQDVMAEFTGNELIVNNQNVVEQGLKEGNYAKAAAPIRDAMRSGYITPGPETHANNPMPVTSDGTIYAGGGPLSFKVKNGAGIYDHATDQFKSTMSDKKIAEIAQKNINKWKSNNMYS